jgi:hypothetical protein
MFVRKMARLTVRVHAVTTLAGSLAVGTTSHANAAGAMVNWNNPVCDVSTSPRKISVAPPQVTAMDDTTATDRNYIQYWVRVLDATTNSAVTGWTYGGQTTSTDTTSGAFPVAGTTFGTQYYARFTSTSLTALRVQYSIAWYRMDGSLRYSQTIIPAQFKLVSSIWMYPGYFVPIVTGTTPTC